MNKSPGKVRIGTTAILSAVAVTIVVLVAGDARAQTPNGRGWTTAIENFLFAPRAARTIHSSSDAGNRNAAGGPPMVVVAAAPSMLPSAARNAVESAARNAVASAARKALASAGRKMLVPHPELTLGRPISGVGADGTPSSIIAIGGGDTAVGDEFTITLLNDEGDLSTSVNEDGGMGQLGDTSFTENSVDVTAVETDSGPYAIAVYQAPVDFVRPGDSSNPNAANDPDAASRDVTFEFFSVTYDTSEGDLPFVILRPPVVLVHGLWGAPSNWDGFAPFISDPRFSYQEADYSNKIGLLITSFFPNDPNPNTARALSLAVAAQARANSLGFQYNAPTVLGQIGGAISNFENGANPLGLTVAATQADLVVHSMGGDISRYLPLLPNFYDADSFGYGPVHKVITVDTPHLGSPVPFDVLQPPNRCVADLFTFLGNASFQNVEGPMGAATIVSGALGDLSVDPSDGSLSPALFTIHQSSTKRLPTALLAGSMGSAQLDPVDSATVAKILRSTCSPDPLALNLTSAGWPTVFNVAGVSGNDSDAMVSVTSEFDGVSGTVTPAAAVHSGGVELLGFGGPNVLEEASGVPQQVIDLLNVPVTNTSTFMMLP